MIKAALIGTGNMGRTHYDILTSLEDVELIAMVDARGDTVRGNFENCDIPIYTDIEELFENHHVDMVDICTPTPSHVPLGVRAMHAGAHVLCEKPMSTTSAEAEKLAAAARETGKCCMIAQVVRFMAPYMYLKSVLDSGELGHPVKIDMLRMSGIPRWSPDSWFADYNKSGGSILDMNLHDIDFCSYAFGEPKDVRGVYYRMKDNNDFLDTTLLYDDTVVNISGGWYNYDAAFRAEYLALFSDGMLELRDGKVWKNGQEVDLSDFSVTAHTGIVMTGEDGYRDEIRYFVSCIKAGSEPELAHPESTIASVRLVERMRSAAKIS